MSRLDQKLTALATMSPAQLRETWATVDGSSAPSVPVPLLRRLLAQRLQEKRFGGLPAMVVRELERMGQEIRGPKLVSLSCLAPDIVTAIVEGRQPSGLCPDFACA